MLSFHPLTLDDKPWVDRYVFQAGSRSADFNFGSMYMWDDRYRQLVCDYGGRLVVLAHSHKVPIYPFPIGGGQLEPVIEAMRLYAAESGFPFVIRGVEESGAAELESLYPGRFAFSEDRQFEDYIYSAEKLDTLAGKKLHAKRNFINRFTAENQWSFCEMGRHHFDRCLELLAKWSSEEYPGYTESIEGEHRAIIRGLESFEQLGLTGGCLFSGERLIAFCIGELISEDCVDVHFEKAEADIAGAYPMINREFVRLLRAKYPKLLYINREDDMGLDNLRQAKLSYHPDIILKKFTAAWKE